MKNNLITILLLCFTALAYSQKAYVPIVASRDDAEELNGMLDATDLEIDMGWENAQASKAGFVFRNIQIDRESVLNGAYLLFTAQQDFDGELELKIELEDNISPTGYWDTLPFDGRSMFPEQVIWSVDSVKKGELIRSSNVASLMNLLLAKSNWFPGKDMNFVLSPTSSTDSASIALEVYSFNQLNADYFPKLEIYLVSDNVSGSEQLGEIEIPSFFPNPSSGVFYLKNSSSKIKDVRLYSANGAVLTFVKNPDWVSMDLSDFVKGIYFAEILTETQTYWQKLLLH